MQDFDSALKELFQVEGTSLFTTLGGAAPREWLNVELARTRSPRADLVAWLENGTLFHLEFQSNNDGSMLWRMLEYYAFLFQRYGVEPVQVVLYLGSFPLTMSASLAHQRLRFRYQIVDVRQMDGEELLRSPYPGDNVLAVLCRTPETKARLHRIAERLAHLDPERRKRAARLFLILSFLRGLGREAEKEISAMPIVIDPMEDSYLRGLLDRGHDEGHREGRKEGQVATLRDLIKERFGGLPEWAERRLKSAQEPDLTQFTKRLLNATTVEEIFD